MGKVSSSGKRKKTGSKILLQILVLVLTVFIISGIVSLVFYLRSTSSLTQKSKDKVISSKAEDMSSGFGYVADVITEQIQKNLGIASANVADLANSIMNKQLLPFQVQAIDSMQAVVDKGVLGTELLLAVIPPIPPAVPEPLIMVSNNEKLVYSDVPEEIYEILKGTKTYGILKNGIPEWNVKGETLVIFKEISMGETGGMSTTVYATAVRSIEGDVTEIDGYFNTEKKNINILMTVVIVSFSIVLFIIIFVVLNYLIRSKITRPIDELADAAEKVMEGDIDIEVPVREGEEFANLKKAFNEMLKSIRDIISRSTGDSQ